MKLKYSFEAMDIDEHTVGVPVGESADKFHGIVELNDSAAVIFELLKEETSQEQIVEQLKKQYSSNESELIEFVDEFVGKLNQEGLLE